MNEGSSESTPSNNDINITGINTNVLNTDSDNEVLQGDKKGSNYCYNTIEIDKVEHKETFLKEVKIDIDLDDSTEKIKSELVDKSSQSDLRKVAERIIALDRRVLMTVWLVFPAFFTRKNPRNQTSQNTEQSVENSTKQEAPAIESGTRRQQNQGLPQRGGYNSGRYGGGYDGGGGGFGFQSMPRDIGPEYDPKERNRFIAVVFGIVFIMLVFTAICLGVIFMIPALKFHFRHMYLFYMIGVLIIYIVLTYCFVCGPCSRDPWCGSILLILTFLCMTVLAAAICVQYKTEIILYAVVATAVVCGICLLLAMSSFDFTGCLIYVIVIGAVLCFMSIAFMVATLVFNVYIKPLWLVLLIASAILQSVTMIIQLQMILGHRTLEYDEGEYFLAAFQLYTSIIQMFITLVQILGLIDSM